MKTSFFENHRGSGRFGTQNWDLKGAGKTHRSVDKLVFCKKRISKMKTSFFENRRGSGRFGTQNWDPKGAGKTHRTTDKLDIFAKPSFKNENIVF